MRTAWPSRVALTLALLIFAWAQAAIWNSRLRVSGDEPHELMTVLSMLNDGDLNVYPNYQREEYRELGYAFLRPQVVPDGEWVPPEKGIGFPALLAPFYALAGKTGARVAVVSIAALAIPLLYLVGVGAGLSRLGASFACLGLVTCLPWEVHANLILPEAVAGTITMAIAASYLRFQKTEHRGYALLLGLLTVALPVLYLKYTPLALASGVFLLSSQRLRSSRWTYAGAPLLLSYGVLWVSVYGWSIAVGTGGGPHDFHSRDLYLNVWNAVLDKNHGMWPWAPLTFLALCGFVYGPAAGRSVRAYLVVAVSAYMLLYGLTTLTPGSSAPGRYLSAAVPAQVGLAALGLLSHGACCYLRLAVFWVGVVLSAVVLVVAIGASGFQLPAWYLDCFPALY